MKHAARNKLILHGQAEVFEQGMTEDNLELDMNVMDQARDLIPPEKTRDRRMIASRGVWPLLEPEREKEFGCLLPIRPSDQKVEIRGSSHPACRSEAALPAAIPDLLRFE
ncbi:MAG: hypothetical protein WA397_07035 [Roseiarcus sp.]